MDEIKHFFNQLDSLKSSFKPWTNKLKQALKIDEMDNYKEELNEPINNEDIINQYIHVSYKLNCLIKRIEHFRNFYFYMQLVLN